MASRPMPATFRYRMTLTFNIIRMAPILLILGKLMPTWTIAEVRTVRLAALQVLHARACRHGLPTNQTISETTPLCMQCKAQHPMLHSKSYASQPEPACACKATRAQEVAGSLGGVALICTCSIHVLRFQLLFAQGG